MKDHGSDEDPSDYLDRAEQGSIELETLVPSKDRECRICFEKVQHHSCRVPCLLPHGAASRCCAPVQSVSGRMFDLVAPCLCRGTSGFVHRTCLDRWRASSASAFVRCHECKFEYRLRHDNAEGALVHGAGCMDKQCARSSVD